MSENVVPEGYMVNAKGQLVPSESVKEIDKLRDELVREMVRKGAEMSRLLASLKSDLFADVGAFIDLSAQKYGVSLGGTKGNVTLSSFDGSLKALVSVNDYITFDERLQAAKALIDKCLRKWSEGSGPEIRTIIMDAFDVEKTGKINVQRVLALRRLAIEDDDWKRAMEAISDSVQVAGTKQYIRLYRVRPDGGQYQINLDIASA